MAGKNRFMCICDCGPKGEKDKCKVRECRRNTQIFEAWENLRKAAVKSSDWKRKRHLEFLQSAVPLHIRNGSGYDAPMISWYSVFKDFWRAQYPFSDKPPVTSCQCQSLWSEEQRNLKGSVFGNCPDLSAWLHEPVGWNLPGIGIRSKSAG